MEYKNLREYHPSISQARGNRGLNDISTPDFSTPRFNPGPFNPKFMDEKSGVEKFMAEKRHKSV